MQADSAERAAQKIARLAGEGLDVRSFWQECNAAVARVVPHYLHPCWFTLDPATLLITSHHDPAVPQLPGDYLAHEYNTEDVLPMSRVARSASGVATIHDATEGDPVRSVGWRNFVQPFGGEQQLLVALRTRRREVWGMLAMYREPDRPRFSDDEMRWLASLSGAFAAGARRGLLVGELAEPPGPHTPVLLLLAEGLQVRSMSPGTEAMLARLPDGASWRDRGALPPVVVSVSSRAMRDDLDPDGTHATVRGEDGSWLTVHAAPLAGDREPRVAVIIEPADPRRISPLLMAAYDLTGRERDVVQLVLDGDSTTEIASALHLSEKTVQQHLKSVFDKTGVRSRRELVSKVFFAHCEPRLRDNEQRDRDDRPFRGYPVG